MEVINGLFEIEVAKAIESIYKQAYDRHGPEMAPELIETLFELGLT